MHLPKRIPCPLRVSHSRPRKPHGDGLLNWARWKPRKRASNRRNAARSTGRPTEAGRLRASRNSLKHGLPLPSERNPEVLRLARARKAPPTEIGTCESKLLQSRRRSGTSTVSKELEPRSCATCLPSLDRSLRVRAV